MVTKIIKIFVLTMSFFSANLLSQVYQADSYDSISRNFKKYYTLGNLRISKDGRYASVKQIYKTSRDTMLIIDRKKPEIPITKLIKKNQYFSFIRNNRILSLGGGEAELLTLPNLKTIQFTGVSQVAFLEKSGHYLIMSRDEKVKIFDENDELITEFFNVKNLLTDDKKNAFLVCENEKQKEVFIFNSSGKKYVYKTASQIKRIELSASEKHLIITEISQQDQQIKITFINSETFKVSSFMTGSSEDLNSVKIFESALGDSYLIDVQKKVIEEKTIPEIWYANDGNLKAKDEFAVRHEYFNWNTNDTALHSVPMDRFPLYAATNSKRYLLAFDPYTNYRYETRFAVVDLYLYDLVEKKFSKVFSNSEDLMVSPKGRFLLSYNYKSKEWLGKDILDNKSFSIPKYLKSRPIFNEDDDKAYFQTKTGLYEVDLIMAKTKIVENTNGFECSLSGYSSTELSHFNNINSYYLKSNGNSILQLRDSKNRLSLLSFNKNTFKKLRAFSSEKITDIKWDAGMKHLFSIEENYNLPSRLVFQNLFSPKSSKLILDKGNQKDTSAQDIRQHIIDYNDSFGNPLKGTLYYPSHFQESEKYPLVVYIYMRQSTLSNDYIFPSVGPAGFDLRTLLDKGYFVYMPDIVFSNHGTGLSALDCINQSIDALKDIPGIDHERLGLTGHSMGGYETNFIATHSNRFKTYIAGSAHSDVVRAYFSYHYDWGIPYTWQFENGQYFMNEPFSKNKDKYFKNNPIYYVENVNAPMLIWTGKKDENVKWDHTMEFYVGLLRNRKQAIALFYPAGLHNLGKDTDEAKDLNKRSFEWWDYHLKDKTNIPWINKQMKKDAY